MSSMERQQDVRFDADAQDEINLGELFNVLLQRKWLVIGVFLVVLVIGTAYALFAQPIYEADALIQVEDQKGSSALGGLSVLSESLGLQQSPVAGEIEILRSREVLLKAINQTQANVTVAVDSHFPLIGAWLARRNEARTPQGLAKPLWGMTGFAWGGETLEFAALDLPRRQWGQTLYLRATEAGFDILDDDDNVLAGGQVGQKVAFTVGGQPATLAVRTLEARPGVRFRFVEASPTMTYENLRKALSVSEAGKQSSIITLTYQNPDDAFAVDIVNAIAHAYLEQNVQRRSAEARSSLAFLQQQLPDLKRNVDRAEDALSDYRSRSSTISVDKEAEGLLTQAVSLENNKLQLQMKRDEMLQRFKPEHPEIKAINKQIAALDGAMAKLDKEINRLPQAQRELLPFERDARVNTQLYMSLLNNAQELRVAEAGTIGNVRVIDYAVPADRPVKPKKTLVVAISAALGAFLGILAAFLAYFLRPALQRPEQIEQATGLSTYVSLPESEAQEKLHAQRRRTHDKDGTLGLLALDAPQDPAVESLRSLRTGLTFALMGAPGKVIALTGATAAVGKSFVTANFATLLAATGQRVVVVDCDMRRPRLGEYFGYARKAAGLSGLLAAATTLDQVLRPDVISGLSVLPAGQVPPNPGELLLSERFGELLQALSEQFDLVLLDTPPILPVADSLAILRHATAAFLIARAEQSTAAELRDAMTKLRHSGVADPVRGVIFNRVRRNRVGYGASYKYYYSYR